MVGRVIFRTAVREQTADAIPRSDSIDLAEEDNTSPEEEEGEADTSQQHEEPKRHTERGLDRANHEPHQADSLHQQDDDSQNFVGW